MSGLLAAVVGWYLLDGLVPRFLEPGTRTAQVLLGGTLAASAAVGATLAALRVPASRLGVAWGLWPAAAAVVFVATGAAKSAQLAGMAASALGGLVLWAWLRPAHDWLSRTAAPLVVLLGLAALQHLGYGSEVGPLPMALILVPGLLLGLWTLLRPVTLPAAAESVLLALLVLAPLSVGLLLSASGSAGSEDSYGGYDPYG